MKFLILGLLLLIDPSRFEVETKPLPSPTVKPSNVWLPPLPSDHRAITPLVIEPDPIPVRRLYVFGYSSCGPCIQSEPHLLAWLQEAGLPVTKPTPNSECVYIDIERFPRLAEQWNTTSYPTVIVSDDLKEVARHVGAYTKANLQTLWETNRREKYGAHVASAFASAPTVAFTLPRVSINPTTKAVTILETIDIPYGNYITATLQKDCVLTIGNNGQCTFSQPYPRIRTRPIHWDGYLRGVKVDTTARTAVLQIDGFPDQTVRY